ncbi:hypothetical protein CPB84DRAFT_1763098 [Gymnopilus junonius]|uniref:Uncharacterized protein n=1 Tax=Gymnopilus junonius TaxID=109634 RepID=A0A9P5TTK0_GYMJU|nr:hypothetical protein CPB84DRAFT_1763098 [Gymnopilus junonius]
MRYRDSTNSFVGLAYDTDMVSPGPTEYVQPMETPVIENPFEGRARVRSGYFAAGAYPRISTLPSASYSIATATRINVAQRGSFTKDKYPSAHHPSTKRFRDTQALTYALGLASPKTDYGASSPQPTLYPDDSMSVAEIKHGKKRNMEVVPDVPVIRPMQQGGTGADTFMTMDFGVSQMSLTGLAPDMASEAREPAQPDRHTSSKPPRVPSPPPLPSLAQMALAQHNPEAYASYRSPTYSLYGLYETSDRKSLVR